MSSFLSLLPPSDSHDGRDKKRPSRGRAERDAQKTMVIENQGLAMATIIAHVRNEELASWQRDESLSHSLRQRTGIALISAKGWLYGDRDTRAWNDPAPRLHTE